MRIPNRLSNPFPLCILFHGHILIAALALLLGQACTSRQHVRYLRANTSSIPLGAEAAMPLPTDTNFYAHDLFMMGEIHEVGTSPRLDVALFKHLHHEAGVRVYLAEMDAAQSHYLNRYLHGADDLPLEQILAEWVVYIGTVSTQVRDKYRILRDYNLGLPESDRFELVGLEPLTDFGLTRRLLVELLALPDGDVPHAPDSLLAWGKSALPLLANNPARPLAQADQSLLRRIVADFAYWPTKGWPNRDRAAYQNFKALHAERQWAGQKLYACFGFAHTLQGYGYTLAGRIKRDTTLKMSDKILSINALYVKSHLTVQSVSLPKFMRDKADFTRMKLSYDNPLFMRLSGIGDYKRVTTRRSINLVGLNAPGSPYAQSLRGTRNFAILPIWDGFRIEDKRTVTTDYAQYVFFIRNADWVLPD